MQRSCILYLILLLTIFAGSLNRAFAASSTIRCLPQANDLAVGEATTATITIQTGEDAINALKLRLQYLPDLFAIEASTEGSFVQLWITNPSQHNPEPGIITLAGGLPTPGFVGEGLSVTLSVTRKGAGDGRIIFLEQPQILLNDGEGTDDFVRSEDCIFQDRYEAAVASPEPATAPATAPILPLELESFGPIDIAWPILRSFA